MTDEEFKEKTGLTRSEYIDMVEANTELPRDDLEMRMDQLVVYFDRIFFVRSQRIKDNEHG